MPFGLKNTPSILQRCVNDILHEYIGEFAYVYIELIFSKYVLIFSKTEEEHMKHISIVFEALHKANMKISDEKSHFFEEEIEFLGHLIINNKITIDPEKVTTIREYQIPKTLKNFIAEFGAEIKYKPVKML